MTRFEDLTRRDFLATTGAVLGSAPLALAQANPSVPSNKLALEGGEKSVKSVPKLGLRWGDPERERLDAMLRQDTLFYWKGPQTTAFIEAFRRVCPAKHVMPCSSGTAALHIAVAAAGIGPGDEVITSPITDMGTVVGTIFQQGVPVFADLGPTTYNLDPADVERRVTPKTKAIIAVHLCGNPCDLLALKAIADRHGLILIEDCAQAWGARYRGEPVGTAGHLACWSLQNSKHVTCGDGGVVASNDERFGPLLQRFGDKGFDRLKGGLYESFATNYRMTEPQAAVATAQLDRLESIVQRRAHLGERLTRGLKDLPGLRPHGVDARDRCSFWFYFLRLQPERWQCDRSQVVKALVAEGVDAGAGYIPVPLHRNPVFQKHAFFAGRWPVKEMGLTTMDYTRHETPEAEAILSSGIRLTLHEAMNDAYIDGVVEAMGKVARHYAV
ncbi:MAG: DegT/DnrJ/EryC1/StrS family aminotransferase [Verrucomicrobiales bacterium]|nr:DegT/DnrJ/EryC1/StrS family aminotransferase [Verrucomicrobiales bacterium]